MVKSAFSHRARRRMIKKRPITASASQRSDLIERTDQARRRRRSSSSPRNGTIRNHVVFPAGGPRVQLENTFSVPPSPGGAAGTHFPYKSRSFSLHWLLPPPPPGVYVSSSKSSPLQASSPSRRHQPLSSEHQVPSGHSPQTPPQPSSPQSLSIQSGAQATQIPL